MVQEEYILPHSLYMGILSYQLMILQLIVQYPSKMVISSSRLRDRTNSYRMKCEMSGLMRL